MPWQALIRLPPATTLKITIGSIIPLNEKHIVRVVTPMV